MLNIPEKESTLILVSKFNEKFQTEKKPLILDGYF